MKLVPHVDGDSFADRDPIVDDDFDPTSKPEPEVKDSSVLVVLAEALILWNNLKNVMFGLISQALHIIRECLTDLD